MATDSTRDGEESPGQGAGGRTYLAEVLSSDNAKLSDYRLIRRAINDGYPIPEELKQLIIDNIGVVLRNENGRPREKIACMKILLDATKQNLELVKLGHKDLHQFEKERRQQSTVGKLPANDPDAPDSVSKQPTKVSLENFVLSLPELKIADEPAEAKVVAKRTA